ncbi:hypothetical protein [Caryophanon latum]|uniref:Uncharacterized protein n=1 Tax=Caryophanon latum TaxID=33977 RepID=A0A1C0YXB6_9BACL|nr:hypothetical protein [Caryophanon latum]OCS91760.1 hypothetical protein A6K76_01205 [Caryophanon latum]
MSLKDLEDFINKNENEKNNDVFNWENEKKEWIDYVDKFYKDVECWLEPLGAKVTYQFNDITLHEESYESYTIRQMQIGISGYQVFLEPIGTMLIGAKGRIDLKGPYGLKKFLLLSKDRINVTVKFKKELEEAKGSMPKSKQPIDWNWRLAPDEIYGDYLQVNADNFYSALLSVVSDE